MRGKMRKESDDARQDDGKNENSILHVLAFVAFIAFVLAGVYLLVHHACAEKTMKPFLKGEYDGRWYKFESGVYTVEAKTWKWNLFYGEVHILRTGSNRIVVNSEVDPETTCALMAWRKMRSTDFGLMISDYSESGIRAYLIELTERGEIDQKKFEELELSKEEKAFVRTYVEENRKEIQTMMELYHSIGD